MARTFIKSDLSTEALIATSVTLGGGSALLKTSYGTASINFANMAANATSAITATLTGAVAGRPVVATPSSVWSGDYLNINVVPQVLADGVVTVTASNKSAGAINPDAVTFEFVSFSF